MEEEVAEVAMPELAQQYKDKMGDQDVKMAYASVLIKHRKRDLNRLGVNLLDELKAAHYHVEDVCYMKALGLFKMGKVKESRKVCELLIRMNPDHSQAQRLHGCIVESMGRDDAKAVTSAGLAALGVGLGALALGALMGGKKR
ncbi:unnamed protein product [Chrysoparadoxa australica]